MKYTSLKSTAAVLAAGIAGAALIGTIVSMGASMAVEANKSEATASIMQQCGISFDKHTLTELSASLNPSAHALRSLKALDLGGMHDEVCKPIEVLAKSLADPKTDSATYANNAYMARAVLASVITYRMQNVLLKHKQVQAIVNVFDIPEHVVSNWSSSTMKSNLTQYGFKAMENNAGEAGASLSDLKATVDSPALQTFIDNGPGR